jgi:hypothetical protein
VSRHGMGWDELPNVFAGQTWVARGVRNRHASKERADEEANRCPLNRNARVLSTLSFGRHAGEMHLPGGFLRLKSL